MIEILDKLGRPVNIDDIIVYAETNGGNGYKLEIGIVRGFLPSGKGVHINDLNGKPNGRKNSDKFVVFTDQYLINKEKYPEFFI